MSAISIVIPSRLQSNPNMADEHADDPELWLDRAVNSILRQSVGGDAQIIVSTDAGAVLPRRFIEAGCIHVSAGDGDPKGQAAAVNRGVAIATGDVLGFLEDDDGWEPQKLEAQLPLLADYDLVTSNARETAWNGDYERINDFATPSSWCLRRETWDRVGGFDESFRWHVDTEWLGRANALGLRRMHLTDTDADKTTDETRRKWLANVRQFSAIGHVGNDRPLVNRTNNPGGGMAAIDASWKATVQRAMAKHTDWATLDPDARMFLARAELEPDSPAAISDHEHERMLAKWGDIPW